MHIICLISSAKQMIHKKYQTLFSLKNAQKMLSAAVAVSTSRIKVLSNQTFEWCKINKMTSEINFN